MHEDEATGLLAWHDDERTCKANKHAQLRYIEAAHFGQVCIEMTQNRQMGQRQEGASSLGNEN